MKTLITLLLLATLAGCKEKPSRYDGPYGYAGIAEEYDNVPEEELISRGLIHFYCDTLIVTEQWIQKELPTYFGYDSNWLKLIPGDTIIITEKGGRAISGRAYSIKRLRK